LPVKLALFNLQKVFFVLLLARIVQHTIPLALMLAVKVQPFTSEAV
jgi:hypothetical protein